MVIWRGWGILALFIVLIPLSIGIGFVGPAAGFLVGGIVAGVLLLIAAVGLWFLGQWLNVTRPRQKIDEHLQSQALRYEQLFHEGRFQAAPGMAVATDPRIAKTQADAMLDAERQALRARIPINHSMFWIPLQWWSVVAVLVAFIAIIAGILASS
ncbi:hypothetical protein [Agrococcus baldri]|uniref:Uncharacterized protein n=1 Tax=Agrococcus baldri TaxID=153730 RepID=A0AA87RM14_9MICO|nr:hypothetical protein [Agrococcus baldri]GEK81458.1 hypothetical protein ABA31_28090 [Agrococcus baldri]